MDIGLSVACWYVVIVVCVSLRACMQGACGGLASRPLYLPMGTAVLSPPGSSTSDPRRRRYGANTNIYPSIITDQHTCTTKINQAQSNPIYNIHWVHVYTLP